MTSALALIPQIGAALAEHEPRIAAWIGDEADRDVLEEARRRLDYYRARAERGSDERDAATRLGIRIDRRLGQLPEAAPAPPAYRDAGHAVRRSEAEGRALSRARALAAIPADVFEEKLAEPHPTRARLLAADDDRVRARAMSTLGLDDERSLRRLEWRSAVLDVLTAVAKADPAIYIPLLDDVATMPGFVAEVRDWLDRIEREIAATRGLHVIGGRE